LELSLITLLLYIYLCFSKSQQLKTFHTIIIGGGPAGLFTAISVGRSDTLLLEKNSQLGKKLLIAGSGRCNITHAGAINDFFNRYGEHGKFLKSALKEFTNVDIVNFFSKHGLNTVVDKNGKIFPVTDRAEDVLSCLMTACLHLSVNINVGSSVVSVSKSDDLFNVVTDSDTFHCNNLVIATGGASYPTTGSTGDGYSFAKCFGHTIVDPKPALTPVFVKKYELASLAGVSLHDVSIGLFRKGKKIAERRGDLGFTHKGISGPGIIDFSRSFEIGDVLKVNLIGCDEDNFRRQFIDASARQGNMTIQTLLRNYNLPKSLMRIVLEQIGIEASDFLSNINTQKRTQLVVLLCSYPFEIERVGSFKVAMTTAGGVNLHEVDPKTMMSKLVPNLYFAGEVLDIDGDTGGYNIQAAFSTGHLVGKTIRIKS